MGRWRAGWNYRIWPHLPRLLGTWAAYFIGAAKPQATIGHSVANDLGCAKRADLQLHRDGRFRAVDSKGWISGSARPLTTERYSPHINSRPNFGGLGYTEFFSRSHDAVIRVYDEAGNVIGTHEHAGEFKEW
jgi:hypothetical protein